VAENGAEVRRVVVDRVVGLVGEAIFGVDRPAAYGQREKRRASNARRRAWHIRLPTLSIRPHRPLILVKERRGSQQEIHYI
jgi:hypothetical protein